MKQEEIYQALAQLGELHQQGVLSDEEFQTEKQALLQLTRTQRETETSSTTLSPSATAPEPADALDIFATGGGVPPTTPGPTDGFISIAPPPPTNEVDAADLFVTGGGVSPESTAPSAIHSPTPNGAEDALDFFATGGTEPPPTSTPPTSTPQPSSTQGTVLAGRYQVLKELGRGGMGQVLHALDLQTQSEVALKTLHHTGSEDDLRQRFLQELTLHERLQHPNIVRVQGLERDPQVGFFFTMDYAPGQDLHARLREAKRKNQLAFAWDDTIHLLQRVADALDHAHQQGVLHLDLKPSNVLLSDQGIKLIDFGIARLRSQGGNNPVLGTVYYMAPEQLSGEGPLQVAADIYALGVLAYQLLTGQLFQGGMPGPSQLNPALSEEIDAIHAKAVAWKPEERFQKAGKFVDALRRAGRHNRSYTTTNPSESNPTHEPTESSLAARQVHVQDKTQPERYWPQIRDRIDHKRPLWLDAPISRKPPQCVLASTLTPAQHKALVLPPRETSLVLLAKNQTPLLEFCPVPAGTYRVGGKDRAARRQEKPAQSIQLQTFWCARIPVTNAVWSQFLEESRYQPNSKHRHPNYLAQWVGELPQSLRSHPVNHVSYADAWAFCDFYGLSLPSEAQWEAAQRGPDGSLYPWGNEWPPSHEGYAHTGKDKLSTRPVHAYLLGASPFGLLGGLGNTREWTADEFDTRWLRQLRDEDPIIQGQDRARFYALRGTSSTLAIEHNRIYRRDSEPANECQPDIGFRPCLDLPILPT